MVRSKIRRLKPTDLERTLPDLGATIRYFPKSEPNPKDWSENNKAKLIDLGKMIKVDLLREGLNLGAILLLLLEEARPIMSPKTWRSLRRTLADSY